MRTDNDIWREFLDFRIEECLGLWSEAVIDFPFGRMTLLHPHDAPCLLMYGSLEKTTPAAMLAECEGITAKLDLECAFFFSSAWRGDVAALQTLLRTRGYRPHFEQVWMIKDDLSNIESIPETEFTIDPKPSGATIKDLYRRALGASEPLADRLKRKLDTGAGPVTTGFVVARTNTGEAIACGGYSHLGRHAYFHCLGTLPDYQRRGIARHIAKARFRIIKERGAEYAVAAMARRNTASIEMQKSLGYRVLQETIIWRKS